MVARQHWTGFQPCEMIAFTKLCGCDGIGTFVGSLFDGGSSALLAGWAVSAYIAIAVELLDRAIGSSGLATRGRPAD